MRRSINWRLSAILLAICTVCTVCMYGLHHVQVGRSAGLFLKSADQAIAEEDFTQALQSYRNYLRLQPEDLEVHAKMGYLLADGGGYDRAFTTLEEVVRQDSSNSEARRRLVEVALLLGRFGDAEAHAIRLLGIPNAAAALTADLSRSDAELVHQLGQSIQMTGDLRLAASLFVRSIVLDPQQLDVYARLGALLQDRLETPLAGEELLAILGQPPEDTSEDAFPEPSGLSAPRQADRIMQALVDNNPDSAEAHLFRGNHLNRASVPPSEAAALREEAAREAATALRLAPDNPAAILFSARCEMACGRLDEARKHAERGRGVAPDQMHWYLLLSRLEILAGDSEGALVWVREGIAKIGDGKVDLMAQLANMLVERGRIDQALEVIAELKHFDDARVWIDYLSARVLHAQEEWLQASRQFEVARPHFVDRPELRKHIDFFLGQCHEKLGDVNNQLAAYRRAVAADPRWVMPRIALADTLDAQGAKLDALQELRQLERLVPREQIPANTLLDLARLVAVEKLTARRDRGVTPDWEPVRDWLAEVASRVPNSPRIPILQAELKFALGQVEEAVEILTAAIEQQPDQLLLRSALSDLYAAAGERDKSEEILGDEQSDFGDSVTWRLARARRLTERYGKEASDRLHELAEPSPNFSRAEDAELCYRLAVYAIRLGDVEQAGLLADRLAANQPDNLNTWLLHLELAQHKEQAPDLSRVLQAVDRIQREGPVWHFAHAVELQWKATSDDSKLLTEAISHLNKARSQRPGWAPPVLLTAHIQLRQGQVEAALENYVQAIELAPQSPADVQRTVQLLYQRQRFHDADHLIQLVETRHAAVPTELGQMAAQISLLLGEYDRAMDVARSLAAGSGDHASQIWLGRLAEFRGRQLKVRGDLDESEQLYAEAEASLRNAIELSGETPEPWVLLVRLLHNTNRDEEARQTMGQMQQRMAADLLPLATAQCYETLAQWQEAERNYVAAVNNAPADPLPLRVAAHFFRRMRDRVKDNHQIAAYDEKAAQYLQQLLESTQPDSGYLLWARRELAKISLARNGFEQTQTAERLLIENLDESPGSLVDLRMLAIALSRTPARHTEAVELWERVVQESPTPLTDDRYSLAVLYEAVGEFEKSSQMLLDLATTAQGHPDHPKFVVSYIHSLIEKSELNEAETWIGTLRKVDGLRPMIARLNAEILVRRGQDQQAIDTLVGVVNELRSDVTPENRATVTRQIVDWLKDLRQLHVDLASEGDEGTAVAEIYLVAAEQLLRGAADSAPAGKLALAGHLARQHDFGNALDLVEAISKDVTVEDLRLFSLTVAESGKASPQQMERVGRLLQAALDDQPETVGLLMAIARLRDLQGRYDESVDAYRRAIELRDDNFVAMNNLAMVLVGQNRDLDQAQQYLEQAVRIAGRIPALLDSQALLELALERPRSALHLLDEAVQKLPAPELFFHRAVAYHRLGQTPLARSAMQEAAGLQIDRLTDLERQMHQELAQHLN